MTSGAAARRPKRASMSSDVIGGAPAQERTLRAQGRRTLRRLLDASLVVFERKGYHGARVDDICAEARTSHGTFYLYFSSKEDLFKALLNDVSEAMVALSQTLPAITPDAAGHEALRTWVSGFFDLYVHYHTVIRAWMDTPIRDIDLAELGAGALGSFATTLTRRIAEVQPRTIDDPGMGALAAVAMIERFSYYGVLQIVPLDRAKMLDTLASILHVGLFGGQHTG